MTYTLFATRLPDTHHTQKIVSLSISELRDCGKQCTTLLFDTRAQLPVLGCFYTSFWSSQVGMQRLVLFWGFLGSSGDLFGPNFNIFATSDTGTCVVFCRAACCAFV